MVRPHDHAQHVRRNQPYKADRTADGYAYADQPRYRDHQHQLRAAHVHAHVARVVLAHGKGVQFLRARADRAAADDHRARQHHRVRIIRSLQAAHRPECDGLHLIRRERNDYGHRAGYEHRIDHADQYDRIGGKRAIQPVGERQDDDQR